MCSARLSHLLSLSSASLFLPTKLSPELASTPPHTLYAYQIYVQFSYHWCNYHAHTGSNILRGNAWAQNEHSSVNWLKLCSKYLFLQTLSPTHYGRSQIKYNKALYQKIFLILSNGFLLSFMMKILWKKLYIIL